MDSILINDNLRDKVKNFFETINISFHGIDGFQHLDDKELLTNCLIHQMQTGNNVLKEYIEINNLVYQYHNIDKFIHHNRDFGYWQFEHNWEKIRNDAIIEIDNLLDRESFWHIHDDTIAALNHTKQVLGTIHENPLGQAYKQKTRQELLDRYYNYTFIQCENEVEKAKKNIKKLKLLTLGQVPSKIDFYPIILMVFDSHRNIVNMFKVNKNLELKLEKLNNQYPSHKYGFLSVDERMAEHIFASLCVYFNPKDLKISAFSYAQSPYKSINTIKSRYKGEMGITLRTIKKICEMYKIDIHYLNNDIAVIDRSKINQALSDYTGRDFTKHPDE